MADNEWDRRMEELREWSKTNIESLNSNLDRLTADVAEQGRSIDKLIQLAAKDGESIRALAVIVQAHQQGLDKTDGSNQE